MEWFWFSFVDGRFLFMIFSCCYIEQIMHIVRILHIIATLHLARNISYYLIQQSILVRTHRGRLKTIITDLDEHCSHRENKIGSRSEARFRSRNKLTGSSIMIRLEFWKDAPPQMCDWKDESEGAAGSSLRTNKNWFDGNCWSYICMLCSAGLVR